MLFPFFLGLLSLLAGGVLAADSDQLRIIQQPIPEKLVVLTFDDGCGVLPKN
jgi:hypothetical protein